MDAYFARIKNKDPNKMIDTCKLKNIQYKKIRFRDNFINCRL